MATTETYSAYTGPSDREVVAVLQRMASARAQLMNAERLSVSNGVSQADSERNDEIEETHADLLWAQAQMLTSTKNLRKTKAVELALDKERGILERHGYANFHEYLSARTSTPTADVHLTLARREYEEAESAWDRLQSEMEVAEPTMIIDLTGDTPRSIL